MPYGSRSALMTCAESGNPTLFPMSFNLLNDLGLKRSNFQDNSWSRRPHHGVTMAIKNVYSTNQKDVLIDLNCRLAAYLEKVKTLEESNHKLEQQIQQVSEKRVVRRDYNHHQKTIAELESQINRMKLTNSELYLNIENTKLAADGLRAKYDTELATRLTIEDDMKKMKANISDLNMQKHCLETEVQILSEKLENLKRDHTEDREHLLQQKLRCQVNVEVESLKTTQLTNDLDKLRQQYNEIADHHMRASAAWFDRKETQATTYQKVQSNLDPESLVSHRRHLNMLRRSAQELKVEHEVLQSLNYAQEAALYETISGFDAQLQNIQEIVLKKEDELSKLKAEANRLATDSRLLCYMKDLLEMEIQTYGLLMVEEENRIEEVIHEQPCKGIMNNRQMFLFLISESMSVTTKNPVVPEPSSGHSPQLSN
ncbi:keratin, type I cytoskeletal 18-like isoform X2 [Bufo gargarizans]|uniref:keratin, type I cytoskeletal 18-like isoform X2 n=1 Tax=Bufo gargarizans TaxID=30331 RepID=UPI001CF0F302|nr:keratin, type I cytoskeletal 18-like isoform X2 [Bufo gargarizans]